ncbi:hypothetical protein H2199_007492 [Coniosporium tulheliwenetii]|uniref:Uncharacterized protein n=1 Tax=Coniosporium tulheliwenetii TaxID=3383036 RepID=A0ACC2YPA3_9PEZI|nr:hypothetical protein H2199_007492 [Cladosporium sp. JES 115]
MAALEKQRASNRNAPPLPPRTSSTHLSPHSEAPPPYTLVDDTNPYQSHTLSASDPRNLSTDSLVPVNSNHEGRRRLLLVYIHGFMGTETSFQSFPAHVHNLVNITLADTHVIHTKIYPRYRSRRSMDFARDDFSKWLSPHESPDTDVILLGHSMGGLLSAEVVLLPPYSPATGHAFRHRILGTINFDTPFLGMHPGIVSSGLKSLVRSSPDPSPGAAQGSDYVTANSTPARQDTLLRKPTDPNYNPVFPNDVNLPVRKGWNSTLHFLHKHSDDLVKASKQYVKSHIEFGGAMADYKGLKRRYERIRALEYEDENMRKMATHGVRAPPRVRFVNYYTASTGRPKRPKSPSPNHEGSKPVEIEMQNMSLTPSTTNSSQSHYSHSRSRSPRISVDEHRDGIVIPKRPSIPSSPSSSGSSIYEMGRVSPTPIPDTPTPSPPQSFATPSASTTSLAPTTTTSSSITGTSLSPTPSAAPSLPPIPPMPAQPTPPDLSQYPDKDTRKIAEKDHERAMKAYKRAIKDRDSAIKDRAKLEEKRRKQAEKQREEEEEEAAEKAARNKITKPREMTHDERERERLENERLRMERESRRMRGESSPPPPAPTAAPPPPPSRLQPPQPKPTPPTQHLPPLPPPPSSPQHRRPSITNPFHRRTSSTTPSSSTNPSTFPQPQAQTAQTKKKKDKKFCVLPSKNEKGERDPTWVRVYMEGVDEVGAHCGLFFMGETYEMLVGDVAGRIEEWVRGDTG